MKKQNFSMLSLVLIALLFTINSCKNKTETETTAPELTAAEAKQLAIESYIFGYSLMSVDMSSRVITNVAEPTATRAPMGQLVNLREYPTAAYRDVTAPNADTLYSSTFVDVTEEPWIISWPAMGDRYYVWEFYSAWVPVIFDPGSRTTGQKAQTYAITGPNWKGTLPEGVVEQKSPTGLVWILARTYCDGSPKDYAAVHALQDQYKLTPLSSYGKTYSPPKGKIDTSVDMKMSVRDNVNALDAETYFNRMAQLMVNNPPRAEDAPMVEKLTKLGVVAGKEFDLSKFPKEISAAIEEGTKEAWQQIVAYTKNAGEIHNGWTLNMKIGHYGTDYMARAWLSAFGIPANAPKDAVYLFRETDATGKPLDATTNKYVMHFKSKSDLPPANGFWSLTMYDTGWFFIANPLNRYTLSQRDKLKANADGSIDLYIQHENPGPDKVANWLPAPKGGFIPCIRLYWAKETTPSVLNGTWEPPQLTLVN